VRGLRDATGRALDRPEIWRPTARVAAVGLLGLALLIALGPGDRALRTINAWTVFHYTLGTKYFDELGYFDLYNAALLADAEEGRVLARQVQRTRDLRTYYWIARGAAIARARADGLKGRFTPARWTEFKRDLRAILSLQPAEGWIGPLLDRGFNPSPAWLVLHRPLLGAVELSSQRMLAALCAVQLLLYLLTFAVAWWGFGGRAALLGALWFLLFFANGSIKQPAYFSNDWFCLTVAAAALYRRGHGLAAAPLLAYAAMMRGFPGLLALHPALAWLAQAIRLRRPHRRHTRFLLLLATTCVLLVGLGSLTPRGFGAWFEWRDKIAVHVEHHRYTANIVGLHQLAVHDFSGGRWSMSHQERERLTRPQARAGLVLAALLAGLTLLAMLRRDDHDGQLLGLAAIFFGLILSRYYISVVVLLFTWSTLGRRRRLFSTLWLFGLELGYYIMLLLFEAPVRQRFFFFNLGLTVYFIWVLAVFLRRDLRWLRGRRL
jgi:hypothetical protein